MLATIRFRTLCIAATLLGACHWAHAHNLFVLVEPNSEGADSVDVIFEHSPYPGKGTYNQPHLDRGKTWVRQHNEKKDIPLELKAATRLGKKFLQTKISTKGPRVIVHSCKWGVYKGRLDFFHGKYLDVSSAEQVEALARTPKLPLDLVPAVNDSGLTIRVLFEGKPLAGIRVSVWSPSGKETKQATDSDGVIKIEKPKPGTYSFGTTHTQKDLAGEFNGESYKGVMHGTTCSLRWPVK